ncbi:hypothetical protein [Acuticoccus kandeliae]|uniref:hypothetical protein n=1 Tax=Acuticoccus kandeliae TaxID=2073160 RepID=UPI0013003834|nr:hypothetical protein [Acuticoccus kandeliae]
MRGRKSSLMVARDTRHAGAATSCEVVGRPATEHRQDENVADFARKASEKPNDFNDAGVMEW